MAKKADETFGVAPGPLEPNPHLARARALILERGPPDFTGARPGYQLGPGGNALCWAVASEMAGGEGGLPYKQAVALAFCAYWRLYNERKT